jgi:hypothetical protein
LTSKQPYYILQTDTSNKETVIQRKGKESPYLSPFNYNDEKEHASSKIQEKFQRLRRKDFREGQLQNEMKMPCLLRTQT